MANPNLLGVSNAYGNSSCILVTSNANPFPVALVNNPASSGKVFKVNMLSVTNTDGLTNQTVTIKVFSEDDLGGTGNALANAIVVPLNSSVVLVDKTASFYLLEDKSIGATAYSANSISVTCSWEEIG